jgi:hypothetical protein
VTVLMAVGTNLSALWILIANGWMQNPVGAEFSYVTMRMEMTDFWAVVFNPDAQAKFVHTVSAGYVTGAMFVLSISPGTCCGARRGVRQAQLPRRRGLRLASCCSVIVLGDESGYTVGEAQQTKLAAMEAMWETEPAPAGFNLIAASQRSGAEERLGDRDSLGDGPDRHPLDQTRRFPASTRSRQRTASASCPASRRWWRWSACARPNDEAAKRDLRASTRPTSASACC